MNFIGIIKGFLTKKKKPKYSIVSAVDHDHSPFILCNKNADILYFNKISKDLFPHIKVSHSLLTHLRSPSVRNMLEELLNSDEHHISQEITLRVPVPKDLIVWVIKADDNILFRFDDVTALRKSNKMHRDFVANVSHELRTPLASILGFVETLKGGAKDDPKTMDQFLDIMHAQGMRMKHLIDGLLSLSRVEIDQHIIPTEICDITKILRDVGMAISPLLEEKSICIKENFSNDERLVKGDKEQLFQTFQNITENAMKYSDSNTIITYKIDDIDNGYYVHIIDQGQGIEKDHIPRLTERFYRTDNARNRNEGGAGLGLSIVSKIIQRHGGNLEIDSEVGKGSDFKIFLPKA